MPNFHWNEERDCFKHGVDVWLLVCDAKPLATQPTSSHKRHPEWGARLRGCTTTHASKKSSGEGFWEGFWGRVLPPRRFIRVDVKEILRNKRKRFSLLYWQDAVVLWGSFQDVLQGACSLGGVSEQISLSVPLFSRNAFGTYATFGSGPKLWTTGSGS